MPVDREQAAILIDTFLLERSLNELDNALRSHPSRAASPLVAIVRPRSRVWGSGLALALVVLAVFLYTDRDVAPIFGHLSPLAGEPHR